MKNREKYAKEMKKVLSNLDGSICGKFIKPIILKTDNCNSIPCASCSLKQMFWLDEEYVEEEEVVDWDKVEKGTMIEVSENNERWLETSFVGIFEDRFVCESRLDSNDWVCWEYARLIK